MVFNLRRVPWHPAIEPRTQEPSLHNPLYAALPLGQLQLFHNDARHGEALGVQQAHIVRHRQALLQPVEPAKAARLPAWAHDVPKQAFTPTVHAPSAATGRLRQVRRH